MTLRSHKSHRTTPPNMVGRTANAAATYREVAQATALPTASLPIKAVPLKEPLWLPAGWLAVVLMLSASVPAMGSQPVWRARTTAYASPTTKTLSAKTLRHTDHRFRPVGYEEDIAGPALRVAGRMNVNRVPDRGYRVAQGDSGAGFGDALQEALERPFGVDDKVDNAADNATDRADESESLFDDLPADPFDETVSDEMNDDDIAAPAEDEYFEESAPEPQPTLRRPDVAEDIQAPRRSDDDYLASSLAREREEASQDCSKELAKLKSQRLNSIDLAIGVTGVEGKDFPFACSVDDGSPASPRCWAEVTYMWKASALCHKPLYFEDVHLERYGHSWGPYVQPLVSGAHFFGTLPVLPYKMGLKTPNECVYTLGHYRPGDCAPYLIDPVPFTWRAAWFQAAGVAGVAAFLP